MIFHIPRLMARLSKFIFTFSKRRDTQTHCCLWPLWPRLVLCLCRVCKDLPRSGLHNTLSQAFRKQTKPKSGNTFVPCKVVTNLFAGLVFLCFFFPLTFLVLCKQQQLQQLHHHPVFLQPPLDPSKHTEQVCSIIQRFIMASIGVCGLPVNRSTLFIDWFAQTNKQTSKLKEGSRTTWASRSQTLHISNPE